MPKILTKIGLVLVIIIGYFFGIRELRQEIHSIYLGTILPAEYGAINSDLSFYSQSSVSFTFCEDCSEYGKGWQFRIPFDSYWLFSMITLVLISADKQSYLNLAYIHLSAGILTLCLVLIGIQGINVLMMTTDFISRYGIPLASFGYVAFVYGNSKKNGSDGES